MGIIAHQSRDYSKKREGVRENRGFLPHLKALKVGAGPGILCSANDEGCPILRFLKGGREASEPLLFSLDLAFLFG
jgi:hypothetical protein